MTRREAIAIHEATHTVVALHLNLPVEWVSLAPIPAVSISDSRLDLERDRHAVLVSMAAPSFLPTYDRDVDRYAELEAKLAYRIAGKNRIDPDWIYDDAATLTCDLQVEVYDLAERLEAEGRILFALVHPDREATLVGGEFDPEDVLAGEAGDEDDGGSPTVGGMDRP